MDDSTLTPGCAARPLAIGGAPTENYRPNVFVLLAAYNGAPWIAEQLHSILRQHGVTVHVEIRDDRSSDSTREELARFERDERINVTFGLERAGAAAQNFFALIREHPATNFDYVALSDQDDVWQSNKLLVACNALATHGAVGYSSSTIAFWPDGRQSLIKQTPRTTSSDFLLQGAGQGCTFVLAADFYQRAREFLISRSELATRIHYHDWALYALARAWNLRWTFDVSPSVRYRQHDRNDTGARNSLAGIAKRLSLIRSGWYRAQLRAIADLCFEANPASETISRWRAILSQPDTWSRRIRIANFCARGGRRTALDNAITLLTALAGWL